MIITVRQSKIGAFVFLVSSLLLASSVQSRPRCGPGSMSAQLAVRLQNEIFRAMAREDRTAWNRLVAPEFVALERGKTYDRDTFYKLVVDAQSAGLKFEWSVNAENVQIDCKLAVMNYINIGSVSSSGGSIRPLKWLETTSFKKMAGRWRAVLLTSIPADEQLAPAPPK